MSDPSPEFFITKGLFPENLPPVFTTKNVWPVLAPDAETYSITTKAVGGPSLYNASKRGGLRRLFAVPHPQFIKDQGIFFKKHWSELQSVINAALGSASQPIFDNVGPRHVRITPHRDLPIWLLKELNHRLTKAISDAILGNSGSLVLALLAHFSKNKMAGDKLLYSKLRDLVDGDPFAGAYWPLTLELVHLAEGDSAWGSSSTVGPLRVLHDAKISLVEWNAPPRVFAGLASEEDKEEPEHAIEDYGSDYTEDNEDEESDREQNIDWTI